MSAASGQGLTPGSIRTHIANPNMGATHTIKVAAGTTPQQTQAIFNAIQAQQIQRQNSGQNLRLQQSGTSLVAVSVPQPQHIQQSQSIIVTSQAPATANIESSPSTSQQSQQQQQGQAPSQVQQQVRNCIVKKRMQSHKVTKNQ